jgi:hypothetical protein
LEIVIWIYANKILGGIGFPGKVLFLEQVLAGGGCFVRIVVAFLLFFLIFFPLLGVCMVLWGLFFLLTN